MKKGILFDLDGTLWDSSAEVVDSWLLALADYPQIRKQITREAIQSVMGKVMDEIGEILLGSLPQKERMEVLSHCVEIENQYIAEHGGRLFAGAREALQELSLQYPLYIVSNCQQGYIEAFLQYYGLGDCFADFESYGKTGRPKGENICLLAGRNQLDAAVYVGDTQWDYEAACFAGMPFIHARTGYGTVAEPVVSIEHLSELLQRAEEVMGGRGWR